MTGIGLLHNPHAKRNVADPDAANRLDAILGNDGISRRASTIDELRAAVAAFKEARIELLAVGGGDGTNHVTIKGLMDAYGDTPLPAFALLRGGTMNTIANSFGIPRRSPEVLLGRYKRCYARRGTHPMRFIEPNVMCVGEQYGFIFGTGAIYGYIAEYNRRETRDALWAAKLLATACASATVGGATIQRVAQRWRGSVRFDDGSAFPEADYLTIGGSTCGQIGLGFRPFYRSGQSADEFHMLGIFGSPLEFIMRLPRLWQGRSLGPNCTYEKMVRRATLEPSDGVMRYTIDGDVYEQEGKLEIACGPKVRIIIPEK